MFAPIDERTETSLAGPNLGDVRRSQHSHRLLPTSVRALSLVSGILVAGLLVTARGLEPSRTGRGTHQQLGLPPCTSIVLFGAPCPACGMTTSWALFTRCQIAVAAESNLGGLMLAIIGLATIPANCYFCLFGTATRGGWYSLLLACSLLFALLVSTIQWAVNLASS